MTPLAMAPWVFLFGLTISCVLVWGAGAETPQAAPPERWSCEKASAHDKWRSEQGLPHDRNASPNPGERPPHTHRDRQQVPATCTGGGDPVRRCSCRGRSIAAPQKANPVLLFPPALPLLGTNAKGSKAGPWTAICSPVFTAAGCFTVAKRWTQPVSMDGWMNKKLSTHMEYHFTIKRNKILPQTTMWMDLEDRVLSEMSQTQKDKHCGAGLRPHMTPYMTGRMLKAKTG